jgi:NAD+ kinase
MSQLMPAFSKIGLIGRSGSHAVVESLKTVLNFLERRDCKIFIEEETAASFFTVAAPAAHIKIIKKIALADECDLVIVVGGDGSMLGAARVLCKTHIPVLGINRGSLGFLTDISPDEIESRVSEVLEGKFIREERFLLDVTVSRKDSDISHADAMNEVVVHRGTSLRMIEFALYIDGQFVYSQHSDGLIASTPTGSTAYSLSGGGPILHPSLDAIALVPMFSHALTSRPIVVDGNSKIKIVMGNFRGGQPEVSCDGQNHLSIEAGDTIHIHKKNETLSLIHPVNYNYYETCRTKLGWGSRLS